MKKFKIKSITLLFTSVILLSTACRKEWLIRDIIIPALTKNTDYVTTPCSSFAPNFNISVEFCEDAYIIDTKSKEERLSEHPKASKTNKVIFIHFTIDNYKKEYNSSFAGRSITHELFIIDNTKAFNSIVKIINIDESNREIVWMNPKEISPNYASSTSGTIRTSIGWNAQQDYELEQMGDKKYRFYIKTSYPVYLTGQNDPNSPTPCYLQPFCNADGDNAIVNEIYNQNINLKNYQKGTDGLIKREKIMNLYMFGNGEECDMTKYIWNSKTQSYSFAQTFTMVWSGEGYSDINVLPNFMPNSTSNTNYANPTNNAIPEFLVSRDGYTGQTHLKNS